MNPELANKDTSGISLAPSAGTPGADCQDGLPYPPPQLDPLGEVQLLLPPPAAIVSTQFNARLLLQLASGVAPYSKTSKTLLVQVLFQVVSGTYPSADAWCGSFVGLQYGLGAFWL